MNHVGRTGCICWTVVCCCALLGLVRFADAASDPGVMKEYLERRVAENPRDPSAWRLLGVHQLQFGHPAEALHSFRQAVSLDPENAAIRFGLAETYWALDQRSAAIAELDYTIQIAPDSEYAGHARARLSALPAPAEVLPASYEIRRFDGSERTSELVEQQQLALLEPSRRWHLQFDVGALYNSNVALTPTSRSFGDVTQASPQGFFNPYVEWLMLEHGSWTLATAFNGYFTMNQDEAFGALNLQSYEPSLFVERFRAGDQGVHLDRLQYDFTLDEFDGTTFGSRHALTASWTGLWDNGNQSVVYWTSDFTNFRDDGTTPATTSRDGWTHSVGASHTWCVDRSWIDSFTMGGDLEWADTQGDDYRYLGGSVYGGIEKWLTESLSLSLEGGWGYRDYYDAGLTPSRNEHVWQASAKLRRQWSERFSTAVVFTYDHFNSDNELYRSERYVGGVVGSYEF